MWITHVYNGPTDLLGKTFSVSSILWDELGTHVGPDSQVEDGYFADGEPAIWVVEKTKGRLYESHYGLPGVPTPFRPAPRDWPFPTDSYLAGKLVAEELGRIGAATPAARAALLMKAAAEGSPLMSAVAVRILAQADKRLTVERLRALAEQTAMPVRGQCALDGVLADLEGKTWYQAPARSKMTLRWVSGQLDKPEAMLVGQRLQAPFFLPDFDVAAGFPHFRSLCSIATTTIGSGTPSSINWPSVIQQRRPRRCARGCLKWPSKRRIRQSISVPFR